MDSATVFGVSTESMQMSYDPRGNSIPTILLLLQRHMYSQGGLQAEGIFRLTAGNSQEEYVRDQLNRGVIPQGVDVHCLAGLIKAWFRELPRGILDSLSPEQVIQCQSEEACDDLVRLLPPTEASLLDWAINLMADVVQEEHQNKMNSRNIAMVFAPNMTKVVDPLTALMYAVQVMNFLKTLIEKTLRERGSRLVLQQEPGPHMPPPDDDGTRPKFLPTENTSDEDYFGHSASTQESDGSESCKTPTEEYRARATNTIPNKTSKSSYSNNTKPETRTQDTATATKNGRSGKGVSNLSRINSTTERCEAWR